MTSCSSMSTCINVCGLQSIQHFWSSKLLNIDNDTLSDEQSRIPTSAFRKQLTKCCSTLKCASTIKLLLQYVISSLLDYFWPIIYALSVQNKEFLQAPPGTSGKQLTSCSSMSTCINVCGLQSIQHFWSTKLLNMDNDKLSDEQSRIPTSAFRKQLTKCCSMLKCASTIKLLLQYVISSLLDYFWPIIYALSVQNKEFL